MLPVAVCAAFVANLTVCYAQVLLGVPEDVLTLQRRSYDPITCADGVSDRIRNNTPKGRIVLLVWNAFSEDEFLLGRKGFDGEFHRPNLVGVIRNDPFGQFALCL